MENSHTNQSLKSLLQNPGALADLLQNPGKGGLDFYNGLSTKEKQYVVFAAAAGLAIYGLYLGRKGK
ncbi:hypothetical protein [Pontibacter actiniarum]|uniref:Uncharacterized protein n=1 Tax=Pontibacter actiniarum TaxID=323450 RepID=A0A1X9YNT5_9BACT|nr:hypothetical protein [Pontibacter actiniarum]ARS34558.1 hypothetical protein CA264_03365 [Pontibacter actiniarum]